MFMRFQGGSVGHLGTCYLDPRLKEPKDNNDWADKELDEETGADIYEDRNSYVYEEQGNGTQEDLEMHEGHANQREPSNKDDELEEDKGQDNKDQGEDEDNKDEDNKDQGEDNDNEQEISGNMDEEQDLEDEDKEGIQGDDNDILDEEGFAEL